MPPLSNNEAHAHDDASEVIYVISGNMRLEVDGDTHILRQGDAVLIEVGAVHQIFNDSPDTDLVHTFTFCPPGPADAIAQGYGDKKNFTLTPPQEVKHARD